MGAMKFLGTKTSKMGTVKTWECDRCRGSGEWAPGRVCFKCNGYGETYTDTPETANVRKLAHFQEMEEIVKALQEELKLPTPLIKNRFKIEEATRKLANYLPELGKLRKELKQ